MTLINQYKAVKETVRQYLIKFPHLKDDDFKLIASIWLNEAGGKEVLKTMSAFDFLQLLSDGKLTHSESIRRSRATLQKEDETLRGEKYNQRIKDGEEFSENIN